MSPFVMVSPGVLDPQTGFKLQMSKQTQEQDQDQDQDRHPNA